MDNDQMHKNVTSSAITAVQQASVEVEEEGQYDHIANSFTFRFQLIRDGLDALSVICQEKDKEIAELEAQVQALKIKQQALTIEPCFPCSTMARTAEKLERFIAGHQSASAGGIVLEDTQPLLTDDFIILPPPKNIGEGVVSTEKADLETTDESPYEPPDYISPTSLQKYEALPSAAEEPNDYL